MLDVFTIPITNSTYISIYNTYFVQVICLQLITGALSLTFDSHIKPEILIKPNQHFQTEISVFRRYARKIVNNASTKYVLPTTLSFNEEILVQMKVILIIMWSCFAICTSDIVRLATLFCSTVCHHHGRQSQNVIFASFHPLFWQFWDNFPPPHLLFHTFHAALTPMQSVEMAGRY